MYTSVSIIIKILYNYNKHYTKYTLTYAKPVGPDVPKCVKINYSPHYSYHNFLFVNLLLKIETISIIRVIFKFKHNNMEVILDESCLPANQQHIQFQIVIEELKGIWRKVFVQPSSTTIFSRTSFDVD